MISPHRQLDLDFATRYKAGTGDERVAELLDYLGGRGWISGRQIREAKHWDERIIRLLAASSDGAIISGQRGYKLTRQATPEEMRHATAWMESQAKQMAERACAIRRVWHGSDRV
jgi:hypothetical protein